MRPIDAAEGARIAGELANYEQAYGPLAGIAAPVRREVLLEQIVESIRRVRWVTHFVHAPIGAARSDPHSGMFDPIKASILHARGGNLEEAYWLLFLFVLFGKPRIIGWRHLADVYGALGGRVWDWTTVSSDIDVFLAWLDEHVDELRGRPHQFGNHRKYESLVGPNGIGAVASSYVAWVLEHGTHEHRFNEALEQSDGDGRLSFASLYESMRPVHRFGRVARFDYLAMVGKVGLAAIEPDSAHLKGSTGPLRGARLLVDNNAVSSTSAIDLEGRLAQLDAKLQIGFDPLEDGLCNWQKSPGLFIPFRG